MKTLLGGLPPGNRKLTTTGALIWLGVTYPQQLGPFQAYIAMRDADLSPTESRD